MHAIAIGLIAATLLISCSPARAETAVLIGAGAYHLDRDAARDGSWCEANPLLGIDHRGFTLAALRSSNCRFGVIAGYTLHGPERSWGSGWWIRPTAMAGAGVLGWRATVQPVVLVGATIGYQVLGIDVVLAPSRSQGFVGAVGRWIL